MIAIFKDNRKKIVCILTLIAAICASFMAPATVNGETENRVMELTPVTQNPIYTVKFNPNKGKVSTKTKKVQYENIYGVLPTPTRSKYTFKGWYTKLKGGSLVTQYSTFYGRANATLYARWQKTTSYEKDVMKYINNYRKKQKLVIFKWDKKLTKGTKVRAAEITKKFAHVRPNGGSGARFLLKYVKKGRSSGECLGKGFNEPSKLATAFMNSPAHRRIIMMRKGRSCAISSKVKNSITYWCVGTSALYR